MSTEGELEDLASVCIRLGLAWPGLAWLGLAWPGLASPLPCVRVLLYLPSDSRVLSRALRAA